MTSYRNSHNNLRNTRASGSARRERPSRLARSASGNDARARLTAEERRAKAREARRAERAARGNTREVRRSIGADTLSMPATRAAGLPASRPRPYGRGETARRVEEERTLRQARRGGTTARNSTVANGATRGDMTRDTVARPAVYTREAPRPRGRLLVHGIPVMLVVIVLMALAIAAIVAMPARMFYHAWRDSGILQVRYEVVAQQNDELNEHVDRLQTLQGIEDEARSRGYVYPGEEALVVEGVEEEPIADPTAADRAVREYEESQPWYIRTLDSLFGYEGP